MKCLMKDTQMFKWDSNRGKFFPGSIYMTSIKEPRCSVTVVVIVFRGTSNGWLGEHPILECSLTQLCFGTDS